MKTSTFSLLAKLACVATVLSAVACSSTASRAPTPNTKSASSATTADQEEPNDKVFCSVDADCDSDERCEHGKCAGLDGDTE